MKFFVTALILSFALLACKNEKTAENSTSDSPTEITPAGTENTPGQVNIPAGPDGIVHHYICPDRCKGGHSDNPGTCPVCGKTLAHNQAFHDQPNAQNPSAVPGTPAPEQVQQITPPQTQEVNIPAGPDGIVHHYICASGCKGGHSPNAGNCPVCGKPLAHNAAFHKQ